jgi:hypothetical protein
MLGTSGGFSGKSPGCGVVVCPEKRESSVVSAIDESVVGPTTGLAGWFFSNDLATLRRMNVGLDETPDSKAAGFSTISLAAGHHWGKELPILSCEAFYRFGPFV